MTSESFSVRELLGLDPRDRLGECSRCGEYQPDAVQLRVIGHQVALCAACFELLVALATPVRGQS